MVNPRRQQASADREQVALTELFSEVEEPGRKRADPPPAQQVREPRPPGRTRRRRGSMGPGRGQHDHLWLLAGAACALFLVLGAAIFGAGSPAATIAAPPAPEPTPSATPSPSPTPTPTPTPMVAFRPAQVVMPALGIAAPVAPVGTASDGQMEIPADPSVIGWWSGGSLIGAPQGNTVLAGHVFNTGWGPGIFARLEAAKPGDEVAVLSSDRQIARYVVTAVERPPKTEFPAQRVFAASGAHQIVLATCGNYNEATKHYQDNILVFASPAV